MKTAAGEGCVLEAEEAAEVKCVCGGVAEGGVVEDDPEAGGVGWSAEGVGEAGEVGVGVRGVVGAWGAVKTVVVEMLRATGSGGRG